MHTIKTSVPLYHSIGSGTAVHFTESGTSLGTLPGTPSLKTLAHKVLQAQKAVQLVVHPPVQPPKKCTTSKNVSGTLLHPANPLKDITTNLLPSTKSKRCLTCDHWQHKQSMAWWCGQCSLLGEAVGFRTLCSLEAGQ